MSQGNKSLQREQNRPRIKKSGLVKWVRGKKVWRLTGGVLCWCWWWMVGKKKCRSALTTFHSRGPSYEKSLEWPRGVQNGLVRDQNFHNRGPSFELINRTIQDENPPQSRYELTWRRCQRCQTQVGNCPHMVEMHSELVLSLFELKLS